jgi:DnaJ-domain-containing protein 1
MRIITEMAVKTREIRGKFQCFDSAFSARRSAESSAHESRNANKAHEADEGYSAASGTTSFDPYAMLGVKSGANRDEMHAAYRREMSNYHPDKVAHLGTELQELAKRKAQAINRAYKELLR